MKSRIVLSTLIGFCYAIIMATGCSTCASCGSEDDDAQSSVTEKAESSVEQEEEIAANLSAAFLKADSVVENSYRAAEIRKVEDEEEWPRRMRRQAMDASQPLPESVRQALSAIRFDPLPPSLTRDSHYWVSNEYHHYLFRPDIEDHGGIYLGVGTDQNYLLAGWARSPIIIPMDFDEQIRNVHHIYGVIFKRVETPGEFIAQWSESNLEEVKQWLQEDYEDDHERLAELETSLNRARHTIHWRLRTTAQTYGQLEIPTFMTDQEEYDFIRNLWKMGRVFPLRGDLTASHTMMDVASALEKQGLHMGLIYVSNAEQYFDFPPEYRRNIIAQPFDDESLMLRTRPYGALGYPEGGEYHYNIQTGKNFAQWMELNNIARSSHLLLRHRTDSDRAGFSHITEVPEPSQTPPEIADHEEQIDE